VSLLVSARQRGFLFDERRDRPLSVGALTEQSSGHSPPPSKMEPNIVRVRVILRLAIYRQSVRLGDKPPETHDQYVFN
jgi:hypothetical protein